MPSLLPYCLYDPHLRFPSLPSRCCFPLVASSFVRWNEGTRNSQEDAGMARDATANVYGMSFLSRWWEEHARKRKRRMRRRFETRAKRRVSVNGRAEARDCCASICNSRSICKRQRNLNQETRGMSLSRSAESERICAPRQPHIHGE